MKIDIDVKRIIANTGIQAFNWFDSFAGLLTSIFWAYLWIGFIKFFFMFAFGMYGAVTGDYELAHNTVREHYDVINIMTGAFVIIMIFVNTPIVPKRGWSDGRNQRSKKSASRTNARTKRKK